MVHLSKITLIPAGPRGVERPKTAASSGKRALPLRASMDRCAAMGLDSTTLEDLIDPSWAAECLAAAHPIPHCHQPFMPSTNLKLEHATTQTLLGTKGPMRHLAPAPRPSSAAIPKSACMIPPASVPPAPSPLREQDRLLPMANIAKLMNLELPPDAKISRDSKLLMMELVTEFICFFTSEANDLSLREGRKVISPEDIYASVDKLGELPSCIDTWMCMLRAFDPSACGCLPANILDTLHIQRNAPPAQTLAQSSPSWRPCIGGMYRPMCQHE